MQQTENLKLNLIEMGDHLSPVPLNENADKVDAALAQSAETAAALEQRVTVLETDKVRMVLGSYVGGGKNDGDLQTVALGATPRAVFFVNGTKNLYLITEDVPIFDSYCNYDVAEIVEGGFRVMYHSHSAFNTPNKIHYFIALI